MSHSASRTTVRDLAERLERTESLVVIDVREPWERSLCAIPVAAPAVDLPIPMGEVPARWNEVRAACAGRFSVVYCHHGVRSRMVADWLARQGLENVNNLEGGIDEWSRSVDAEIPRY